MLGMHGETASCSTSWWTWPFHLAHSSSCSEATMHIPDERKGHFGGFCHLGVLKLACVLQTADGTHADAQGSVLHGHVFAASLRAICMGEPVPPSAVAVMRTNDGRNNCSKKQPYLAFLLPERGRYVWMRSWEAWGLRKCSLCGAVQPCWIAAHAAGLQLHFRERKPSPGNVAWQLKVSLMQSILAHTGSSG
jgi:hypothetical protein